MLKTPLLALICVLSSYPQSSVDKTSDPWDASALIKPDVLAKLLKAPGGDKLKIVYVGFPILYKGAHITSAEFAGPCSKPEGLSALTTTVNALPRDREIVIYCGCCPFVKCPNIRPAYAALKTAGFTHVRVLKLETNLHTDWIEKNYPVEKQPLP